MPQLSTWKKESWEWGKSIGIAIVLAIFIRTFLFAPYLVEGASMESTLHNHDRLVVNKAIYLIGEPKRGDIVVLHATPEKDYIKRVIGVAGDVIEVKNDTLYINGQPVEETYLKDRKTKANDTGYTWTNDFGPITVPEAQVFVLGDNRPNSLDSEELGPFEVSKVVGRAEFVFYPFEKLRMTK